MGQASSSSGGTPNTWLQREMAAPRNIRLQHDAVLSDCPTPHLPASIWLKVFQEVLKSSAPNLFSIASVCRSWRSLAIQSPNLWATIHVVPSTSSELVNLMWTRSQGSLISLKLVSSPPIEYSWPFRSLKTLSELIRDYPDRFASISYTGRAEVGILNLFGRVPPGLVFSHLEELFIQVQTSVSSASWMEACFAPKLHVVDFMNSGVPWNASFLHGGQMTHITAMNVRGSTQDLISVIDSSSACLEEVNLCDTTNRNHPSQSSQSHFPPRPITLPRLKSFVCSTATWDLPIAVLNAIQFSPTAFSTFSFQCNANEPTAWPSSSSLRSALHHSFSLFDTRFSPRYIQFKAQALDLAHPHKLSVAISGFESLDPEEHLAHKTSGAPQSSLGMSLVIEDLRYLFSGDPEDYEWSFDELVVFDVRSNISLPHELWNMLASARCTKLEDISVDPSTAAEFLGAALSVQGKFSPFPTLRSIIFNGLPERWDAKRPRALSVSSLGGETVPEEITDDPQRNFVLDVAHMLAARVAALRTLPNGEGAESEADLRLTIVIFRGCMQDLSEDLMGELQKGAREVAWRMR